VRPGRLELPPRISRTRPSTLSGCCLLCAVCEFTGVFPERWTLWTHLDRHLLPRMLPRERTVGAGTRLLFRTFVPASLAHGSVDVCRPRSFEHKYSPAGQSSGLIIRLALRDARRRPQAHADKSLLRRRKLPPGMTSRVGWRLALVDHPSTIASRCVPRYWPGGRPADPLGGPGAPRLTSLLRTAIPSRPWSAAAAAARIDSSSISGANRGRRVAERPRGTVRSPCVSAPTRTFVERRGVAHPLEPSRSA
jgi:hypothetical protein